VPISLSLAFTLKDGRFGAPDNILLHAASENFTLVTNDQKKIPPFWEWGEREIAHGGIIYRQSHHCSNNFGRRRSLMWLWDTQHHLEWKPALPKGRGNAPNSVRRSMGIKPASLINLVLHPSTVTWYKSLLINLTILFNITTPPGKFIESHAIEKRARCKTPP